MRMDHWRGCYLKNMFLGYVFEWSPVFPPSNILLLSNMFFFFSGYVFFPVNIFFFYNGAHVIFILSICEFKQFCFCMFNLWFCMVDMCFLEVQTYFPHMFLNGRHVFCTLTILCLRLFCMLRLLIFRYVFASQTWLCLNVIFGLVHTFEWEKCFNVLSNLKHVLCFWI